MTNLNGATAYDYWIQAVCGSDSSSYAGPFTFITSCGASVAPTNENFDAGFSVCWSQESNDDFDWTLDANGTPSSGTGPSDDFTGGGNYMYTEASLPRAQGDVATMYSEVIDISGLTNPELRFLNHMYGTAIGTLSVDLWDASTGINLGTIFTYSGDRGNQWNEELIMLSTTATNVQFSITAILGINSSGQSWPGDISIDEFGVSEGPTCPKPSNSLISSSNITLNSADINWQPGANETLWNIEFGQSGFVQGSGNLIPVSSNPFSLTGLNSSTNYDVYIQANCGNGDLSEWSGPHSFNTLCGNAVAPYLETFNNWPPTCWDLTGGTQTPVWNNNSHAEGSFWNWQSGNNALMTSPLIDVSNLTSPVLFFDWSHYFNTSYIGDSLEVLISDNGGATWTQIWYKGGSDLESNDGATNTSPGSFTSSDDLDLSSFGNILQVRFNFISGYGPNCYIDNINIKESSLIGTWKLATIPGAMKVGPNFNDGSWWSSTYMDLFDRACHFDDSISISSNGFYNHYFDGSTFIENWQDGLGDRCDAPVYPHNGIPASWSYNASTSQMTLNGYGAHMGLPKVTNNGEISDPANAVLSTTYDISFSADRDTMFSDINFGPGWWRFVYVKTSLCSPTIYTDVVSSTCSNFTWPVNGNTYTSSNNTDIVATSNGQGACNDSIVLLDLVIDYPSSGTDTVIACDSYTWINGTTYIFSNNTVTHTLTNAAGCDSVVTLDLTIKYGTTGIDFITVCDSYTWIDGVTYTVSNNTATHTLTNSVGCDSVVTLDLTILNSTTGTDVITACDSYTWIDGITYTSSNNVATQTLTNAVGCDSVVTLDLTINYTTTGTDVITACDSYTWIDGITYTSSDFNAKDTLTNAAGCDSIVSLNLSVQYSTSSYSAVTSCNQYDWYGQTYTNNGLYVNISTNPSGCTQTDTLDLIITTSSTTVNDTVCDSYTWNGNTFNTSGTYYNPSGSCVDTLNLVVNYSSSSYMSAVACDEYVWNGNAITGSGLYLNTSTNSDGCPQYDSLDLTVNNSTFGTDVITACDSYTWIDGITYTSTNNTAQDTLVNADGCDSIVTLDLRLNYTNYGTDVITACDSYTWIDGVTYTSTNNTAQDTLTNIDGCDSIVTLDLTINYSIATNDSLTVCDVTSWNGNLYTNTGIYVDTLQTIHGCDSVVTMDLVVNYSIATNDSLVVCDSVNWNGNMYTTTGTYVDILQTIHGCDSVVTMDLVVNYSIATNDNLVTCDSANWNGNNYNSTGIYVDTLQTIHGCDSIVTMDLVVNYSIATNDSLVVCDNVIWNGNNYDSTGIYVDTLQTTHGCDSIVTMDLVVNYSIATNDSLVVCDNVIWNGNNYDSTGIYVDTLQTAHGCDSVVTMDLVVNYSIATNDSLVACDSAIWNGNTYTTTGTYVDTLQTTHGCDSIATLYLTIIDLSVSIDTLQLSLVANIIGGNGPFDFLWNTGDTSATIMPSANGAYWLVVIDLNGCISDTAFFDVTYLPNVGVLENGKSMIVNVYPNPTFGNVTIDLVKQQNEVQITLYDMYGKLILINKYQDSRLIEFSFDAPPGIYYLDVKSGAETSRHKIINQ